MFNSLIVKSSSLSLLVKEQDTTKYVGSGNLVILAIPSMIGLIKNSAKKLLENNLRTSKSTNSTLLVLNI